jgi:hypothetical protein
LRRRLFDVQSGGDFKLGLARKLAQTFDLLLQLLIPGFNLLPPLRREFGDNLVERLKTRKKEK